MEKNLMKQNYKLLFIFMIYTVCFNTQCHSDTYYVDKIIVSPNINLEKIAEGLQSIAHTLHFLAHNNSAKILTNGTIPLTFAAVTCTYYGIKSFFEINNKEKKTIERKDFIFPITSLISAIGLTYAILKINE